MDLKQVCYFISSSFDRERVQYQMLFGIDLRNLQFVITLPTLYAESFAFSAKLTQNCIKNGINNNILNYMINKVFDCLFKQVEYNDKIITNLDLIKQVKLNENVLSFVEKYNLFFVENKYFLKKFDKNLLKYVLNHAII